MNSEQVGSLIRAALLAIGVSSATLGAIDAQTWAAVGGVILSLITVGFSYLSHSTDNQIKNVANKPEVLQVVMSDQEHASAIPSSKVVAPLT